MAKVVVVGAGIIGASISRQLAQRGAQVSLCTTRKCVLSPYPKALAVVHWIHAWCRAVAQF
jgi:glycine/D-amino acid oxidase-like deaminating enzyme